MIGIILMASLFLAMVLWLVKILAFEEGKRIGELECLHNNLGTRDLTFYYLSAINKQRCEKAFHKIDKWTPTDWATALGGECGEVLNEVKKLRRLKDSDKDLDTKAYRAQLNKKIGHELADLIIYADLLATRLDIKLDVAIREKFNIVSDRRNCDIKL